MSLDPVARTAWTTARIRAEEATRPDPLFVDPYAARLVAGEGPAGPARPEDASPIVASFAEWQALTRRDPRAAAAVARSAALAVRHRYFDDVVMAAVEGGVRTVVLLAAGLDTRVYRLPLPADRSLRWIEVDRAETLAHKRRVLEGATPRAELLDIGGDLREPEVLAKIGSATRGPSLWLFEGLLMYLPPGDVHTLLDTVTSQLTPGSRLAFDVPNLVYLDPQGAVAAHIARNKAEGFPWLFASDSPGSLVTSRGLTADVVHIGHPRAHYGRLPWPSAEAPVAGQPTSFLVTARRE